MLDLIAFLAGWAEGLSYRENLELTVRWEESDRGLPKRSAWVSIEGPSAWGQLTVWESGEVMIEAMAPGSGDLLLSEAHPAIDAEELNELLRRLVRSCESPPD